MSEGNEDLSKYIEAQITYLEAAVERSEQRGNVNLAVLYTGGLVELRLIQGKFCIDTSGDVCTLSEGEKKYE